MPSALRRTKIVGTIGPASADPACLRRLFAAGLNVARVTLAHGKIEAQQALVATIRAEADAMGCPVGLLLDLPGPKVRTTAFSEPIELARDATVRLVSGSREPSTAATFVIDYPTLIEDLREGDLVTVGDGAVQMTAVEIHADAVTARVTSGGKLSGRKGVNIPSKRFRGSVPTAEDLALIAAFRDSPVDVVAVSFVRAAADLIAVRNALGPDGPWVMAKIETAAGVENLTEIINASDAIMVARGDLGTELPIEAVPHLQKRIIRETVRRGKPVLVATQMLESMIEAPTPTRAEATDVANAVLDQASALMLSAETAVGHDPVLVIETMDRLIRRAEQELEPAHLQLFALQDRDLSDINIATAHAAWQVALDLGAAAILCCTRTGATARKMASLRPLAPLYGLTADRRAVRQMALCWGLQPLLVTHTPQSTEDVMQTAIRTAQETGIVHSGDTVVVLGGSPQAGPGHTDSVRVTVIA
ncbi:MAG: pyruvate kinase [Vicinamibacterales bacterium]